MTNRTDLRELNAQEIEAVAGGNPIAAFFIGNMVADFLKGEDGDILKTIEGKTGTLKAIKPRS